MSELPPERTTGPAVLYMAADEIERLARLAYSAAVASDEDGFWDTGLDEGEREGWRRAVRAVVWEIRIG